MTDKKLSYESMQVTPLGNVSVLTQGMNGSSLDGGGTFTQSGGGNDGSGDPTPGNP